MIDPCSVCSLAESCETITHSMHLTKSKNKTNYPGHIYRIFINISFFVENLKLPDVVSSQAITEQSTVSSRQLFRFCWPLESAEAVILARTFPAITRQPIELE